MATDQTQHPPPGRGGRGADEVSAVWEGGMHRPRGLRTCSPKRPRRRAGATRAARAGAGLLTDVCGSSAGSLAVCLGWPRGRMPKLGGAVRTAPKLPRHPAAGVGVGRNRQPGLLVTPLGRCRASRDISLRTTSTPNSATRWGRACTKTART